MKSFSIIIPCRNEREYIEKCISSIEFQHYEKELIEIIVIDGLSTDGTREILSDLSQKNDRLRVFDNSKLYTPHSLNIGIKNAKNEIILRLDAHSELQNNYLFECDKILDENPDVVCVGGIITNEYSSNTAKSIGFAMSSIFGVGNAHFRTGTKEGYVDTLAFGAHRRFIFDEIGLFDEDLIRNQDDEYNYRIIKNGYKILLSKNLISKYYVRATFNKLFRQYFQYGYWKVFVNKKHRVITSIRQIIPLFFVFFLMLFPALLVLNQFLIYYFALFLLYIVLAIFFALKKSTQLVVFLKILFSFFILHFSYGLGYLYGLYDFILLDKRPSKLSKNISR